MANDGNICVLSQNKTLPALRCQKKRKYPSEEDNTGKESISTGSSAHDAHSSMVFWNLDPVW
ncbi:hypothetical protein N7535_003102 [Penicillium sp. DV-2018c]|nr:hypothetical protein N7535_003102 [Penicillium sp. DV-2018c]